jgi:predicted flap endonuclease-1-like 5' DNA nuclease
LNRSRFAGAATQYVVRDDLEQIDGISSAYEERLYAGGIETFGQLAEETPSQLAALVQVTEWQDVDFDRWIAQAQEFADLLNSGLLSHDLEEINGIGPVYAKRLRAAGIKAFEELAGCTTDQLADIVGKGRTADYESWISQAKVYAAITSGERVPSELERIKGIGPIFSARLELAGVTTFDALSQLSEDSLHQIIGSKGWSLVHYDRWMSQARQFAKSEAGA